MESFPSRAFLGVFPARLIVTLIVAGLGPLSLAPLRAASYGPDAEIYNPGNNTWSVTADDVVFKYSSYHPTSTLLLDGQVLLTGPSNRRPYGTTELYDPASGTWRETGSFQSESGHTATLLPNGKVLIAGGLDFNGELATAELYDPATNVCSPTGSMITPRENHGAVLLPSGKVLVAGGLFNNSSAELYDPATGTWSATGSLNKARSTFTPILLANGKVLAAGGFGDDFLSECELYDPNTQTWSATGTMNTARLGAAFVLLPNGKVLASGGHGGVQGTFKSAELYNPSTGTWSPTASMGTARLYHTATVLADGKVLAAAGSRYPVSSTEPAYLTTAEIFDPASETWTAAANLNTARANHTATLLPDGRVLVAAGYTPPLSILLNLSTRLRVGTGDNIAIAGFIITGNDAQRLAVRGLGPSLSGSAIPSPATLQDPLIDLYLNSSPYASNQLIASDDDWKDHADMADQLTAWGLAPKDDRESGLAFAHLSQTPGGSYGLLAGSYTVLLKGKKGSTGIGVVELYGEGGTDQAGGPRLANISTRGFVGTGDDVMIGGFIAGLAPNGGNIKVLVRGMGPSLPLAGALLDPTLELHDSNGTMVDANDDWKIDGNTGQSQEDKIRSTTIPPNDDRESALFHPTLPAGAYTVILKGKGNQTGIGLLEIYNLQ